MEGTVSAASVDAMGALLAPIVRRTPLELSERLSGMAGRPVYLKREDTQLCRSYKVRGAYAFVSSLAPADRERGIVCASAGNFAQGIAYACSQLHVHARVFLPSNTPRQK